jgi:hypothetical protein
MFRTAIALFISAIAFGAPAGAQTGPNAFTFVALGDMPYRSEDVVKVDRLIAAINRVKPAFSIHVGDVKSGGSSCNDAALKAAFDQIDTLEQPVVYSIGDNEWTDCHRAKETYDPVGRLEKVRELAFSKAGTSLGKTTMQVESQAMVMPKFAKFVENQRFSKNGVLFIVPHVVGSENGLDRPQPDAKNEFAERNAANIAWIDEGFRVAIESAAKAVVVAFQANPYGREERSEPITPAFVDTVAAIAEGARSFGKPVLIVQGDNHVLRVDKFRDTSLKPVDNVLRLQLFGDRLVHAMRVIVDPDTREVFTLVPLMVPENGPP